MLTEPEPWLNALNAASAAMKKLNSVFISYPVERGDFDANHDLASIGKMKASTGGNGSVPESARKARRAFEQEGTERTEEEGEKALNRR